MWDVLKCFRLVLDESYGLDLLRSSMDWTFYELMDLLQVAQQICPGTTTSNLVSSRKIAQQALQAYSLIRTKKQGRSCFERFPATGHSCPTWITDTDSHTTLAVCSQLHLCASHHLSAVLSIITSLVEFFNDSAALQIKHTKYEVLCTKDEAH